MALAAQLQVLRETHHACLEQAVLRQVDGLEPPNTLQIGVACELFSQVASGAIAQLDETGGIEFAHRMGGQ